MLKLHKLLKLGLFLNVMLLPMTSVNAADSSIGNTVGNLAKGAAYELCQSGAILAESVATAVVYGIANDMVTARVCPEYFTEGFHKEMLRDIGGLSNKTRQALLNPENVNQIALWWGINATWWFGRDLAIPVICAARFGFWPKLGMQDLAKPLAIGMGTLWATGMAAGGIGYAIAKNNPVFRDSVIQMSQASAIIDPETQCRYVADTFAHQVGYAGGALVGAGIIAYTLFERYQRAQAGL